MKKLIYISLVALAGSFTSCEDALEAPSKSSMDESVIFSTPILAEASVMGIHQSFGETNSYRGRFLPFYGINTDIEIYNTSEKTTDDRAMLTGYNPLPNSLQMNTANNAWAKFYEGIERANLAIRGLRSYGNVGSNSELAQLLGEALTLRAVIYLDLVKAWGDVPARFEPITTETLYLAKSDRDVIYKQLLADLLEAESLVAWPNETAVTTSTERVSKAFVKGLRARVALYAAGYSQRPDGTVRRSNDADLTVEKMYAIVKQECLDVINSGTCSLGTFEENFHRLCEDDVTAGKESLWEIPFSDGRGRVLYTLGIKHTTTDQYTKQAQGGANGPLPTMYYDYDVNDIRRDITCIPYEWTNGVQVPRKISSWCFGKLRYEWMSRIVTSTNDDGINWQYMRLADVYMMAAEAINELEGPSAAKAYLQPILDRAYPSAKAAEILSDATASKDAFFETIVDQRAFEFCGEMLRKADLIRWNLLGSKLKEAKAKLYDLQQRTGAYADLPEKIYYKTDTDGESLLIYGLNHGDTDEIGKELGYDTKAWFSSSTSAYALENAKIESLYQEDPDSHQFWPIWQVFLDASNGMLTNDYGY